MSDKKRVKDCPYHFWLIEPPNGEYSKARCKYCPAKAVFRNSFGPDVSLPFKVYPHEATAVWNENRRFIRT